MFEIGDKVEKVGGDYTFEGIIVSVFEKLSGVIRLVVEDDRGVLHVYSEKILRHVEEMKEIMVYQLTIKEVRSYKVDIKAPSKDQAVDSFWNNYSYHIGNIYSEKEISDEVIEIQELK